MSILAQKSFEFSVRVVKCCEHLRQNKQEFVLSNQLLRSGTAIGALIAESQYASSKSDFINKLTISLKEANETKYWLRLLKEWGALEILCHRGRIPLRKRSDTRWKISISTKHWS